MKILVSIVNYGLKNVGYAKQLIKEFQSMSYAVDILVLSEQPKDYGDNVRVIVGLPTKDPWTLPFGHKKLFVENLENYDLFIYTEDDMLITETNIIEYIKDSDALGDQYLPGFIRYEVYPDGGKNYPDFHGPFHWEPTSVKKIGNSVYANFSNLHAACYILTKQQLKKAIASGGFDIQPHSGRYDLICSAATDPFTQCGFSRVINLSKLPQFELHHLTNAYLNRTGVYQDVYHSQIAAMHEIADDIRSKDELFLPEKTMATPEWDKQYYEPCQAFLIEQIPDHAESVLSIGCAYGNTEKKLLEMGKKVLAMPIDAIIGKVAEDRGIKVLPPNFENAFKAIENELFDIIMLSDLIQHIPEPSVLLSRLVSKLNVGGLIVGSVPNINFIRRVYGKLFVRHHKWITVKGGFKDNQLHFTDATLLEDWAKKSGLEIVNTTYENHTPEKLSPTLRKLFPEFLTGATVVFVFKPVKG